MRSTRRGRFTCLTTYVLGALAGLVVTCAGVITHSLLLGSSDGCEQRFCTTFAEFERANPLCIADPSCVAPTYRFVNHERRWMGTEWWDLGDAEPTPADWQALAPVNYLVFIALTVTVTAIASRRLRNRRRRFVIAALSAWCASQVLSWFLAASELGITNGDASSGSALMIEAIGLLVVTLGALGLIVHFVRPPARATSANS